MLDRNSLLSNNIIRWSTKMWINNEFVCFICLFCIFYLANQICWTWTLQPCGLVQFKSSHRQNKAQQSKMLQKTRYEWFTSCSVDWELNHFVKMVHLVHIRTWIWLLWSLLPKELHQGRQHTANFLDLNMMSYLLYIVSYSYRGRTFAMWRLVSFFFFLASLSLI